MYQSNHFLKPGLHNIRPMGHMRPARSFVAACKSFHSSTGWHKKTVIIWTWI